MDITQTTRRARSMERARLASAIGHHGAWVHLMGQPGDGFANRLVSITTLMIEKPGMHSGKHAHMEAVLFVAQGEGYTVIDGRRVPWRAGTSLHIPGPQTRHQHFNTGSEPAFLLRISSPLRSYVENAVEDVFPYLWFEAQGSGTEPADP